jgi:hypothetical protein
VQPKAVVWTLIVLLSLCLACGAIFLIHPSLFTGSVYEITIKSIVAGPHGEVDVSYDDRLGYGTTVFWDVPPTYGQKTVMDSWDDRSTGGSLHPIVMRGNTFRFFVGTQEEREGGATSQAEFRERLFVRTGVHRLRGGEHLLLYRYQSSRGETIEGNLTTLAK